MSGERHHDSSGQAGPYCAVCNYPLEGLTKSSKCPECGNPLVEVLRWPDLPGPTLGERWRSKATIWGKPLIYIAIGDDAVGFVAVGGGARGVVGGLFAVGGGAVGTP